jgi:hypothetical protein
VAAGLWADGAVAAGGWAWAVHAAGSTHASAAAAIAAIGHRPGRRTALARAAP